MIRQGKDQEKGIVWPLLSRLLVDLPKQYKWPTRTVSLACVFSLSSHIRPEVGSDHPPTPGPQLLELFSFPTSCSPQLSPPSLWGSTAWQRYSEGFTWDNVLLTTFKNWEDQVKLLSIVYLGRSDVEDETPILWSPDAKSWLIGKDCDAGKYWR